MKWDYWFGPDEVDRRIRYAAAFRPEYQANGDDVQRRVTAAETAFGIDTGLVLPVGYSSGWRPDVVNATTANAAKLSPHMTAQAGDKRDLLDGNFAWWLLAHPSILKAQRLYMEHPVATVVRAWVTAAQQKRDPTPWCHLTPVAPASRSAVYFPDLKSLPEWESFVDRGGYAGMTYKAWQSLIPAA